MMLEAVRERNAAAILSIFSHHFPEINLRRGREWRIIRAPWQIVEIRLKTPDGSFCWDDAVFLVDRGIYSYDGSHHIMIRDDVYGKETGL